MLRILAALILFGILLAIAVFGLMKSNATAKRLNASRQGTGSMQANRDTTADATVSNPANH